MIHTDPEAHKPGVVESQRRQPRGVESGQPQVRHEPPLDHTGMGDHHHPLAARRNQALPGALDASAKRGHRLSSRRRRRIGVGPERSQLFGVITGDAFERHPVPGAEVDLLELLIDLQRQRPALRQLLGALAAALQRRAHQTIGRPQAKRRPLERDPPLRAERHIGATAQTRNPLAGAVSQAVDHHLVAMHPGAP
ncbi:hypothetical protein A5892_11695 [Halotalea alkalilenta]|uniref:Uncharacterized protein n=1 Tax=Halotalea alkalilenta TaxID=376489 RepID=A0A172YG11_9GAMM|nr:hypothetical protein A5892_11695 [Halotalea alkalilenta]